MRIENSGDCYLSCLRGLLLGLVVVLVGLLATNNAAAGNVYRWVDAQGKVHFGDRPATTDHAEQLDVEVGQGWQPFAIQVFYEAGLASLPQQPLDQARIQREVNWVYRFYDQVLYFDFFRQVPVSIHVFPDVGSYQRYVSAHVAGPFPPSLGIYLPVSNEIAVYLQPSELGGIENTYNTIRHEVSHAIMDSLASRLPLWLNEGVAEQMETLSWADNRFVIDAHQMNRAVLDHYRDQAMDVLAFVEIPGDEWQARLESGPNQAMAGQLVYRLLSTSYGRACVTRLLQDYKRGERLRSYYLLDKHYIGSVAAFKLHWSQWLASGMKQPERVVLQ